MGIFGKKQSEIISPDEDKIVDIINSSDNKVKTLYNSMTRLPRSLRDYVYGYDKKNNRTMCDAIDIVVSTYFDIALNILPGDILVRKYRNPNIGDIVEGFIETEANVYPCYFKILAIDPDNYRYKGVSVHTSVETTIKFIHIISVLEVVKYNTEKYNSLVELLDIKFDKILIISNIKEIIRDLSSFYVAGNPNELNLERVILNERLTKLSM